MNKSICFAALVVFLAASFMSDNSYSQGRICCSEGFEGDPVPLYYDPATGNVTIDVSEFYPHLFTSYVWKTAKKQFQSKNHTFFMDTLYVDSFDHMVAEVKFLDGLEAGVYSLGDILPADLSPDQLLTYFDEPTGLGMNGQSHYALPLGAKTYHPFAPVYGASPHAAMNNPTPRDPVTWATEATLTYAAIDGSLTLDTTGDNGGAISGYRLRFFGEPVRPEEYKPVENAITSLAQTDTLIEVAIDIDGIGEGVHSLGEVLPQGLTAAEFVESIDRALFIGEPGTGTSALDFSALDFSAVGDSMSLAYTVPEPGCSLYWSILLLGLRRWLVKHRCRAICSGERRTSESLPGTCNVAHRPV